MAHRDDHHRDREREGNPELPRQRSDVVLLFFVPHPDRLRLEGHAANRAGARMVLLDLRMHWTRVDHGSITNVDSKRRAILNRAPGSIEWRSSNVEEITMRTPTVLSRRSRELPLTSVWLALRFRQIA